MRARPIEPNSNRTKSNASRQVRAIKRKQIEEKVQQLKREQQVLSTPRINTAHILNTPCINLE